MNKGSQHVTANKTQVLARKLLVYLVCGIAAAGAAASYTWLSAPTSFITSSLLIGMAINATFDYGVLSGRKDSYHD